MTCRLPWTSDINIGSCQVNVIYELSALSVAESRVRAFQIRFYMTSTIGKRVSRSTQAAAKSAVPTSPVKSE
jgi:hypothetical protein